LASVTGGLQRLVALCEPIDAALIGHNQKQKHGHAEETRWLVFATVEGKVGFRWFLWVLHAQPAVVFILDRGRAHDVPEEHLGPVEEGILSVDRYAAYKALQQVKEGKITLAFCWAHVRRDFLEAARSWPTEEDWAFGRKQKEDRQPWLPVVRAHRPSRPVARGQQTPCVTLLHPAQVFADYLQKPGVSANGARWQGTLPTILPATQR